MNIQNVHYLNFKNFFFLGYVDIEDNIKGNIPLYYFENIMGMLLLNVL